MRIKTMTPAMIAALFPPKPKPEEAWRIDNLAEPADLPPPAPVEAEAEPQRVSLVDILREKHAEDQHAVAALNPIRLGHTLPPTGFGSQQLLRADPVRAAPPSIEHSLFAQPNFGNIVQDERRYPVDLPPFGFPSSRRDQFPWVLHAQAPAGDGIESDRDRDRASDPAPTQPPSSGPAPAATDRAQQIGASLPAVAKGVSNGPVRARPPQTQPGPAAPAAIAAKAASPIAPPPRSDLPLPSYAVRGRDGRIYLSQLPTRADANKWYQYGLGEPMNIEIHKVKTAIDTRPEHLGKFMDAVKALPAGMSKLIDVHDAVHSDLSEFGVLGDHSWRVVGKLTKSKDGKTYAFDGHLDQYKPDGYNFDQKLWLSSPFAPFRNILTAAGTPSRRNTLAKPFNLHMFGRVRKQSSGLVPVDPPPARGYMLPF